MFSLPSALLPTLPQQDEVSKAESLEVEIMKEVFNATFNSTTSRLTAKVETNKVVEHSGSDKQIESKLLDRPVKGLKVKFIPAFELVLMKPLIQTICKCRYFNMKVALKALTDVQMPMIEKLDLEVMVFSKNGGLITRNMSGNEILRGNFLHTLSFFVMELAHIAYFRVQITEVSSHYEGKVVSLKVKAKKNDYLKNMGFKVKSLWIKNLIIKAKDLKKKSGISNNL